MTEPNEPLLAEETHTPGAWKLQFAVLCAMLVMALVGMGLSQAQDERAWEYWMLVVFAYASLGMWRSTRKARHDGQPLMKMIGRELAHWAVLVAFMAILLLMEHRALIDRESASDFALLLLALGCCLAGIHFDWLLIVMGAFLTAMVVVTATLQQYSGVMWVVMSAVAVLAAGFVYWRSKRAAAHGAAPTAGSKDADAA